MLIIFLIRSQRSINLSNVIKNHSEISKIHSKCSKKNYEISNFHFQLLFNLSKNFIILTRYSTSRNNLLDLTISRIISLTKFKKTLRLLWKKLILKILFTAFQLRSSLSIYNSSKLIACPS